MIRNDDIDLAAEDDEKSSELTVAEREMILNLFARNPANESRKPRKSNEEASVRSAHQAFSKSSDPCLEKE